MEWECTGVETSSSAQVRILRVRDTRTYRLWMLTHEPDKQRPLRPMTHSSYPIGYEMLY